MFVRNGEVLGSVLKSAVPGAKPKPQKAVAPKVETPPGDSTGELTETEQEADKQAAEARAAAAEPKSAPAKKAAPAKHTGGKP